MLKAAVVQANSQDDVQENLNTVTRLVEQAAIAGAKIVLFPENFAIMSTEQHKLDTAEIAGSGLIQDTIANLAAKYNIWIIAGTIPIRADNDTNNKKVYAACMVYNDVGEMVCRYDKIHMCDIKVSEDEVYMESNIITPGSTPKVLKTPFATIGLAVCYDIRFPELFRTYAAAGVDIITVSSAFIYNTGKAHWHVLHRARAIENQVFVLAANQEGLHPENRQTYGHSMIINPWGEIIAEQQSQPGVIIAELDLNKMHDIRKNFPVLEHKRL